MVFSRFEGKVLVVVVPQVDPLYLCGVSEVGELLMMYTST